MSSLEQLQIPKIIPKTKNILCIIKPPIYDKSYIILIKNKKRADFLKIFIQKKLTKYFTYDKVQTNELSICCIMRLK